MIEELFRQFVKERRYVQNSSPHTIAFYEQSFKTYSGRLLYDNTTRDFYKLMDTLGIEGFDGAFHSFKLCFARNYLRRRGNLIYLREVMGHRSVKVTEGHVEVSTDALRETHMSVSILGNIH